MKRARPLRRSATLGRNRQRQRSEFERCYGSRERVRLIQALPCAGCGQGPSQNAHIRSGGMGRKAGWQHVVPLCASCHRLRDQHLGSTDAFNRVMGVNLYAVALELAAKIPADGGSHDLDW